MVSSTSSFPFLMSCCLQLPTQAKHCISILVGGVCSHPYPLSVLMVWKMKVQVNKAIVVQNVGSHTSRQGIGTERGESSVCTIHLWKFSFPVFCWYVIVTTNKTRTLKHCLWFSDNLQSQEQKK